jgi:hypothetical protein
LCQKCVNFVCEYQTDSEDLKDECSSGDCASGFCDGNGNCDVSDSTVICRDAAGECDIPENCDGTNIGCPTDIFQPSTTDCGTDYTEYGCPWGSNLEDDTGMKLHDFQCDGLGSCEELSSEWQVDEVCTSSEYCFYDGEGNGDEDYFCRSGITVELSLLEGWNLVSFPVVPINTSLVSILASVDGNFNSVYIYNSTGWYSYDPSRPSWMNTLYYLNEKDGIWIDMNNPDVLSVSGTPPLNLEFSLQSEWNLIGYPYFDNKSINASLADVMSNVKSAFAYNASNDEWLSFDPKGPEFLNTLTEMRSGYGCWIRLYSSETWTLENGAFS